MAFSDFLKAFHKPIDYIRLRKSKFVVDGDIATLTCRQMCLCTSYQRLY